MKVILSILLNVCVLGAFAQKLPVDIQINIANKDLKGSVYLERLNDRGYGEKIDSVKIQNSEFVFNASIPEPGLYQLNVANEQLVGLILDGNEKVNLKVDGITTDEKAPSVFIEGVPNMVAFNELQSSHFAFNKKVQDIDAKFKASNNDNVRTNLRNEYLALLKTYTAEVIDKIKGLGTSSAGILATNNFLSREESAEYFDELASQLEKEGKKDRLSQIFIQSVNQNKMGLPGITAPDFKLKNLDGKEVRLSDLKGKLVVVDFWATWCGPCIMSFPGMKKAMEKYADRDDVAFVFIDTFERVPAEKTVDHVRNFVKNRGFDYLNTILDENNQTAMTYGVSSIPTKFFIDKEGKFLHRSSGYAGSEAAVVAEISQWLD